MTKETWTAEVHYQSAMELETAAANKRLPMKVRRGLLARAEAAWQMGDFLRGITAEDWEDECRGYQAADDAMVARGNSASAPVQMAFEMAAV